MIKSFLLDYQTAILGTPWHILCLPICFSGWYWSFYVIADLSPALWDAPQVTASISWTLKFDSPGILVWQFPNTSRGPHWQKYSLLMFWSCPVHTSDVIQPIFNLLPKLLSLVKVMCGLIYITSILLFWLLAILLLYSTALSYTVLPTLFTPTTSP